MSYVVQQSRSLSNDTDTFRVVWMADWLKFANGSTLHLPIAGRFATYQEAAELKNRLNLNAR